jgi:hypothetical protein
MSGACRLWDYFRAHARAVLSRAFPSDGEQPMRQVLAWIRARGMAQVSREDVRRDALCQAPNAHQALQVIRSLERAGFLRKAEVDYAGNGRPARRWDVNPSLIGESLAETAGTAGTPLPTGAERSATALSEGGETLTPARAGNGDERAPP